MAHDGVVRQQVGYARYDTPAELQALRKLYGYLRPYVNFFQPQMKLVAETRHGTKVSKRFDTARTPQAGAPVPVRLRCKEALVQTYLQLNPAELKRQLTRCQARLLKLSSRKPPQRKEVKPSHDHPFKRDYSLRETSRTFLVRQPEVASRTS